MTGHPPYDPPVSERMEEPRDPRAEAEGAVVPDPWKDAPRWSEPAASEGEPGVGGQDFGTLDDAGIGAPLVGAPVVGGPGVGGPEPAGGEAAGHGDAGAGRVVSCPWCATPAAPGARTCTSCGAALAQRESIGDLVIPGLTAVDPALRDLADRPLRLTGPSPSQGVASGAIAAAAMGGPMGIAILGGVAAVAAAEFVGANRPGAGGMPADQVGQASAAALQAIEKLERGEALPTPDSTTPRPEIQATEAPGAQPATQEETADGGA